jgi:CHAD domain-containing protein
MLSLCKGVYGANDTARLKEAFAVIMKETNRLRDLDVYLLDREHFFTLLPESLHAGLHIMFDAFREERRALHAHVAAWLKSAEYADTMEELATQFQTAQQLEPGTCASEPTLPFARHVIWKRYRKVRAFTDKLTAVTPDEQVHRLRIHCKKLCYLIEFFTPLFPKKPMRQLIKALKRLQNNLGRFNDCAVQQESLQIFLQDYAQHHAQSLKLAESIGALVAVLHQQQVAERLQVEKNLRAFSSEDTEALFMALLSDESTMDDGTLMENDDADSGMLQQ